MSTAQEIRKTDAKARLNLPKSFANATVIVEEISASEIRIRKARSFPKTKCGSAKRRASPCPTGAAMFF